jgi:hypothetical protein
VDGVELRGLPPGTVGELAAVRVHREHRGAAGDRLDHAERLRPADDDLRRRVVEKILELALLVADVERQVHEPGAKAGEIQRDDVPVLVALHGDPIAGAAARAHERVRDPCGRLRKLVIMDDGSVRNQQARLLGTRRKMRLDQRIQVRIHLHFRRTR